MATSGRGAAVDQAFERKLAKIEYKMARQGMHREDLRDLVGLTVSRMDMYNIVAALLVNFALSWITSGDLWGGASTYQGWPKWYWSVVIINCFSAVGYLIFSLWFAMHCSIVSHTFGTDMLLNFSRLSIPTNEDIKKLKVNFYTGRGVGQALDGFTQVLQRDDGLGQKDAELRRSATTLAAELAGDGILEDDLPSCEDADQEVCSALLKDDSDADFERHKRRWLRERSRWLSADAYARACMVVGMNQLLQALAYNTVAQVWQVSPLTSLVCLLMAKLLSYHTLTIDIGSDLCDYRKFCPLCFFELLPPVYALTLLFLFPPDAPQASDSSKYPGRDTLYALPVFFMHAAWMLFIAVSLSEKSHWLHRFACPAKSGSEDSSSDTPYFSDSSAPKHDISARYLMNGLHGQQHLPEYLPVSYFGTIKLEKPVLIEGIADEESEGPKFDHQPAKIVRSFTLAMAFLWVLSGFLHMASQFWIKELSNEPPVRRLFASEVGRLSVTWPPPASLFRVLSMSLSDGDGTGSQLFIKSDFSFYAVDFSSAVKNESLGAFTDLGNADALVVLCVNGSCSSLTAAGSPRTWSLSQLERCSTEASEFSESSELSEASVPASVPIPVSWRAISAAWDLSCSDSKCSLAWVAGWDGTSVSIAELRKDKFTGIWSFRPRWKLHPGTGLCAFDKDLCAAWREGKYDDVEALQLSPGGRRGLSVLRRNGLLDAWALDSGTLLGHWQLGKNYTAMAHNAPHGGLHLALQLESGPVIETLPLPQELSDTGLLQSSATGREAVSAGREARVASRLSR
ncbi:unnamed protein product [Polarella glacialis]|uniref:Uncharacterized protein n=1 Tax=Polarella glacialis TaxID=89957 RepID=A0A813GM92_POLGL|nr:unnamed protein product [Polarella glacialis]